MPRTVTPVALPVVRECIPAPSVDSTMAGLLGPTPSEGNPALAALTEEASTEEALTEAAAGDSSQQVIQP
jgi:hypothetical protein